jgi:hypothetical protein
MCKIDVKCNFEIWTAKKASRPAPFTPRDWMNGDSSAGFGWVGTGHGVVDCGFGLISESE